MSDHWITATLLRRYKRFLADVQLPSGETVTVHCPNTGAMTGCMEPGATIWLSVSDNPKRKYSLTWELIETSAGNRICIHSARANKVVAAALADNNIPELMGYERHRREVKVEEGTRADFLLESPGRCVVEVKSVTLGLSDGYGAFPDAVSDRATRHVRELAKVVANGDRAVMILLAMHTGIQRIGPADSIDPVYGEAVRAAISEGVEVLAYGCEVSPDGIVLSGRLPFEPVLPSTVLDEI
ncbi:DNA/RNA nuclease SfsA [Litorivivens sp.]|uniref:DNA/RNA nuclease SfsA n=1 Tax=Litorivivens sp. TaxID=2020868 RepID=UPI00356553A7